MKRKARVLVLALLFLMLPCKFALCAAAAEQRNRAEGKQQKAVQQATARGYGEVGGQVVRFNSAVALWYSNIDAVEIRFFTQKLDDKQLQRIADNLRDNRPVPYNPFTLLFTFAEAPHSFSTDELIEYTAVFNGLRRGTVYRFVPSPSWRRNIRHSFRCPLAEREHSTDIKELQGRVAAGEPISGRLAGRGISDFYTNGRPFVWEADFNLILNKVR